MTTPFQLLHLILSNFIINKIYAQNNVCTDINASFPIVLDDNVCHGLYNVPNIKSYDACAQACCAKKGCEVYKFCPSGSTCGNQACWIGGNDYCSYGPGW